MPWSMQTSRFLTFVGFLIGLVVIYAAGTQQPVSQSEASMLVGNVPTIVSARSVWLHNLVIALFELVPVAGIALAGYSAWTTGLTTASIALNHNIPSVLLLGDLLFTPFFWLEFSGYALSLTASFWLVKSLVQRKWRSELPVFFATLVIMAVVLAVSAMIEVFYV